MGKKREWTKHQQYGFSVHGGSLLLSAAAGSGKTAVLVERVIRMITDPENPVDVDRLLIVTFTRAAAAEMRQRLSDALAKKMAEQPDNMQYARQQMLLAQANISTIDSFCVRLLQEFAAQTDLPVGFRVDEGNRTTLLRSRALDTVLEESYRGQDPAFMQLARQLCDSRGDGELRKAVNTAYEFMQAQPFPGRWLQQQMDRFTAVTPLKEAPWMKPILTRVEHLLEGIKQLADSAYAVALKGDLEYYIQSLQTDVENIHRLYDGYPHMTYDELYHALDALEVTKVKGKPYKDPFQRECLEQAKALREIMIKRVKAIKKLIPFTEQQCRDDLQQSAPLIEALCGLVARFAACYTDLKRQQKLVDFSDLIHEALTLLCDPDTDAPTPLARQLSQRFEEIMVDEYQDCNAAQNALFRALSKDESNLFMVGDVKQSIYVFRQAMPEIFARRLSDYPPYTEGGDLPAVITLGNNFRSREDVTESVNFLFSQLMNEQLGGVAYGDEEKLIFSATDYPPSEQYRTEWMLLDKRDAVDVTEAEMEARQIAARIHRLMKEMTVKDTDQAGEPIQRPLTYGDICILAQKRTNYPAFVKEFERAGIPLSTDKGDDFLSTPEVSAAVSLLRVIDNPLLDVALTTVMMSPLYGFSPDDMAQVRLIGGKYAPLYVAVEQAAADAEAPLAGRLTAFLKEIRRFRTLAATLPAAALLETVYRDTAIEAVYSARVGGQQRVANLRQLDRMARGYVQGEFRGLSAFVRHLDYLEESGSKVEGGAVTGDDSVRIMTIHGSKGLEFPVVFVARLCNQKSNDSDKLAFHNTAGIGIRLVDEERHIAHTPMTYIGVAAACSTDHAAEELRLMYVAMTRAREKLILVYSIPNPDKELMAAAGEATGGEPIRPDTVLSAQRPGQYLLAAAIRHPDFISVRPYGYRDTLPCDVSWAVSRPAPIKEVEAATQEPTAAQADPALVDTLRERIDYRYPHGALFGVPAKLTASQLSHHQMQKKNITAARPAFLQEEGMTAAQKGTVTHTFMQYADYAAAHRDLTGEIARLTDAGFLTHRQAAALNEGRLTAFFEGDLYRRMAAAKQVWREYSFAVSVDADTVADLPAELSEEQVLVQGIADCVFLEEDGLVLVDYKTDKVKDAAELADRYRSQLLFYKQALEQLLEQPVKDMLLYSFHLGHVVEVK